MKEHDCVSVMVHGTKGSPTYGGLVLSTVDVWCSCWC